MRVRLEGMGEQVSDDLIEDVILRGLPKEYDLPRQQSHSDRAFDLQKIKSTAVNMFIDEFSRNRPYCLRTWRGYGGGQKRRQSLQTWEGQEALEEEQRGG